MLNKKTSIKKVVDELCTRFKLILNDPFLDNSKNVMGSDDDDEESDEEDTKKKRRTPKKKAKQLPPWEKFFENLMKKHKGKKKLRQLIQLEPALNAQQ